MPALEMKDLLDLEMAIMVRQITNSEHHRCCISAFSLQKGLCFRKRLLDDHRRLPVGSRTLDTQAEWCEWLQEELDFNLVVFNPYQDLMVFLKDAGMLDIAECAWCASSPVLQDCRESKQVLAECREQHNTSAG